MTYEYNRKQGGLGKLAPPSIGSHRGATLMRRTGKLFLQNTLPNPVKVEVFNMRDRSVVATATITTGHSRELTLPEGSYGVRYDTTFMTEVSVRHGSVTNKRLGAY